MLIRHSPVSKWIIVLFLFLIAAGVYVNTLQNDFVYDDESVIVNNPWIKDIKFLQQIFLSHSWGFKLTDYPTSHYHPLRFVVDMLQYHFFVNNPLGYHFTSIFFHAIVTVIIFFLGLELFSQIFQEKNILFPLIASLLFAVHPVHTEAVAWISALSELLMSLFCLLSLFVYIRSSGEKSYAFIISAFFFLIAALFKITAVILPFLLLLYDFAFSKGIFRKDRAGQPVIKIIFSRYAPFMAALAIFFTLRTIAVGGLIHIKDNVQYSAVDVAVNVFPLISKYLTMLVFPSDFNVVHVFHPVSTFLAGKVVISILVTGVFIAMVIYAKKKNAGLFFTLLWILIPLIPMLYFPAFNTESVFAERYLYLPSVGFALSFAILFRKLYCRGILHGKLAYLLFIFIGVIICLFAFQTINRNQVWKDNYTLWEDSVKKSPDSYTAHVGFGYALSRRGEFDQALYHYQEALRINPYSLEAYNSLGAALYWTGRLDEAIAVYKKVLMLAPNLSEVYNNIGNILRAKGRLDEAIWYYQKTIQLNPDHAYAYNNLGIALSDKGRLDEAVSYYQKAIQINPSYAVAHNNLGIIYHKMGLLEKAEREFQTALALEHNYSEAAYNLSVIQKTREYRNIKK
jgi:Flp pilus assembly protein TadD